MRKRPLIWMLVGLCLIGAAIWFWLHHEKGAGSTFDNEAETHRSAAAEPSRNAPTQRFTFPEKIEQGLNDSSSTNFQMTEEIRAKYRAAYDATLSDWRTPIEFYGKVMDQEGQPVPDANVDFLWNDLSPEGTSRAHTTSDERGSFLLHGVAGKGLSVYVAKTGYYTSKPNSYSYDYAEGYRSNPNQPELFYLRKKGEGVDLVTSQYGMNPVLDVTVPRDGTPVRVDFLNRKSGNEGQMELSGIKPPKGEWATVWSFRMSIPDGGFVEQDDEFPFEAPDSGYQSAIEFQFSAGDTNWTDEIRNKYYIVFGQPAKYGWLEIQTGAYRGVRLKYAVNPAGSRNLEPK